MYCSYDDDEWPRCVWCLPFRPWFRVAAYSYLSWRTVVSRTTLVTKYVYWKSIILIFSGVDIHLDTMNFVKWGLQVPHCLAYPERRYHRKALHHGKVTIEPWRRWVLWTWRAWPWLWPVVFVIWVSISFVLSSLLLMGSCILFYGRRRDRERSRSPGRQRYRIFIYPLWKLVWMFRANRNSGIYYIHLEFISWALSVFH